MSETTAPPVRSATAAADIDKLTRRELIALARQSGLPANGTTAELRARLAGQPAPGATTGPATQPAPAAPLCPVCRAECYPDSTWRNATPPGWRCRGRNAHRFRAPRPTPRPVAAPAEELGDV